MYFFKVWSKNFHILTRSWMRDWTLTNDNNKHKHKNSDSVNFSMMIKLKEGMEFVITSHVSYIPINLELFLYGKAYCLFQRHDGFHLTLQMYHSISVLVPVLVRVPEYLSTSTSTSMSTLTLELTSTSTVRVLEIQYSSTASTSAEYEYPSPACKAGTNWSFYVWAPTSSLKCPTPLDVKCHKA